MVISNGLPIHIFFGKLGTCCFYAGFGDQINCSFSVKPISISLTQEIKRK